MPVKAIANEVIPVSATIFREGHDALGADVIVFSTDGREILRKQMHVLWQVEIDTLLKLPCLTKAIFPSLLKPMIIH